MKNQRSISCWLANHKRAIHFAFNELLGAPLSSFMTIAVITIAITLPLGFYTILNNVATFSDQWQSNIPTISLYLAPEMTKKQTADFISQLKKNKKIAHITYVSPADGLKKLEQKTQLNGVLSLFKKNPLPGVLVLLPTLAYQTPAKVNFLFQSVKKLPFVDYAQIDMGWIKRLFYLLKIGNKITFILAIFFGVGVLLILSSMLRNVMLNHKEEINILNLMGATSSFIRRPLIYCGVSYALIGGLCAIILTNIFIWLLQTPIAQLALTYHTSVQLNAPGGPELFFVLASSAAFGFAAAWLISQRLMNGSIKSP